MYRDPLTGPIRKPTLQRVCPATGLGASLVYGPAMVVLTEYFDKRSSVALGLATAGGSVGAFVVPYVMLFLFTRYGFSGGLLVLGALTFNCCVSGALYRPLEKRVVSRNADRAAPSADGGQTAEGLRSSKDRDDGV